MINKEKLQSTISSVFNLSKKIRFVAVISDSGNILLAQMKSDKHSLLKQENEDITQIVTYINSKSIFVTVEPELTVSSKELLISKIKKLSSNLS